MVRQREKGNPDKDKYGTWKQNLPIMYDWIMNHNRGWPSQSCRWGEAIEDFKYKKRHYLYLSDRTDPEGTDPNKLSVWTLDVTKPRVAPAESLKYDEKAKSPNIKPYSTIIHPGEVNKIRECPQHPHIVVTHTDAKELYVWDIEKQPNRATDKLQKLSIPDLVLVGHEQVAAFALGMSSAKTLVASGGEDQKVRIVPNIDQGESAGPAKYSPPAPSLAPRFKLKGHSATIEDVVWRPGSTEELASVGDDYKLLLWDTRAQPGPAAAVEQAHGQQDVQCVDWSALQEHMLVTGAADGSVKVWDRRQLKEAVHTFKLHDSAIMRVEWAPYKPGVFASGGEDKLIAVWDLERQDKMPGGGEEAGPDAKKARTIGASLPPQLMFHHAGHRSQVVDFQWHPTDPYTMVSVSDAGAGGTLQVWRISDLIWRPIDEVLRELEEHRDYILGVKEEAREAASGANTAPAADKPVRSGVTDTTVVAPAAPKGASKEEAAARAADSADPMDES
ncbi:WD40 repeat-like protein [Coccomyxa subellipsoidea C-169]|uniref:WD40 repeat-like protein n=1 Tax=Coccomyxa subellipsoidea (strain C-169) TaxID=574566 RepID=I0YZY5_COCSC|nr:WD40 repeat-like protein [Coccomyxa subellipsoidea C-169]EIE23954.1 WD40 repeat-like protein [Coccomyxa subellipsoidea C-169]|eukprot:XP_005648498.1 WD40 repeat-like protein [Coccomyxa subellipsoidea C-169]